MGAIELKLSEEKGFSTWGASGVHLSAFADEALGHTKYHGMSAALLSVPLIDNDKKLRLVTEEEKKKYKLPVWYYNIVSVGSTLKWRKCNRAQYPSAKTTNGWCPGGIYAVPVDHEWQEDKVYIVIAEPVHDGYSVKRKNSIEFEGTQEDCCKWIESKKTIT